MLIFLNFSLHPNLVCAEQNPINFVIKKLKSIKPILKCSDLVSVNLSDEVGREVRINSAKNVDDYCMVAGTIDPAINFEVKLPLKNWTQRYVQMGCARLCGIIFLRQPDAIDTCLPAKNKEIVLAANNMGHASANINDSEWGRDFKLRSDFAHKANNLTSIAVKALIRKFYGQAPKYSYFSGCSSGGREGLIEAQRYPKDFDGIIAGASAINFTTQNSFYHAWNTLVNQDSNGDPILKAFKLPVLLSAVLNKCDHLDGVIDGVINTPWLCNFDSQTLLCNGNELLRNCLTKEEIRVVKEIYNGANDGVGNKMVIKGPLYGSEKFWAVQIVPSKSEAAKGLEISTGVIRDLLYEELLPMNYSINNFKFTKENFEATTKLHSIYDSTSPDIKEFVSNGGKILMWHGLNDADISPYNSIAYYHALEKKFGSEKTREFAKLYLLPGAGHCGKGDGPSNLELLTAMMNWVESGIAPFKMIASLKQGGSFSLNNFPPIPDHLLKVKSTRPVYPYPISTEYSGKGDVNNAINFKEGRKLPVPESDLEWLGSKFFN